MLYAYFVLFTRSSNLAVRGQTPGTYTYASYKHITGKDGLQGTSYIFPDLLFRSVAFLFFSLVSAHP